MAQRITLTSLDARLKEIEDRLDAAAHRPASTKPDYTDRWGLYGDDAGDIKTSKEKATTHMIIGKCIGFIKGNKYPYIVGNYSWKYFKPIPVELENQMKALNLID